jgi:4-aminobutyrate aminotransferase / (S)-3-amino-2-methylpropionate transaminase / 5-aminovalerate transaminase
MTVESSLIRPPREGSWSIDLIHRQAGGGLRRIAESAGVTIVDGDGSYLFDDQGRRYLDFVTGYGVAALGHRHPRWVSAVTEQARGLCASPFHNPQLATYLGKLAEVLPPDVDQTALFSGGAEAVEVAVRLAQLASGRTGVLAFGSAFHGKTAGVRFAGGAHELERNRLGLTWLRHAEFPACVKHTALGYETCEESAAPLWEHLDDRDDLADVGAVLVEPVLGTAGNIPPRRRFLSELRRVCNARGWLLILDESLTGFGRTGHGFASHLFEVVPDILVLGKAMGAGFPLSGVAASRELWRAASLDRPSATSSSYGGNPLACAAGLAVLDVLTEPSFLEDLRWSGRVLSEGLTRLAAESPYVGWPRGVGLMLGFDLVDPQTGQLAGGELCARVFARCRDRGLLIAADVPRVRLTPPLTLSAEEARRMLDVLGEALA